MTITRQSSLHNSESILDYSESHDHPSKSHDHHKLSPYRISTHGRNLLQFLEDGRHHQFGRRKHRTLRAAAGLEQNYKCSCQYWNGIRIADLRYEAQVSLFHSISFYLLHTPPRGPCYGLHQDTIADTELQTLVRWSQLEREI